MTSHDHPGLNSVPMWWCVADPVSHLPHGVRGDEERDAGHRGQVPGDNGPLAAHQGNTIIQNHHQKSDSYWYHLGKNAIQCC